jgi:hypothetical protein
VTAGPQVVRQRTTQTGLATGCAILFALPFFVGGFIAGAVALQRLRPGKYPEAVVLGVLALAFCGASVGMVFAAIRGTRAARDVAARMAADPDEPWLWRADWASRQIRDSSRGSTIGLWFFALVWNSIAIPAAVLALRQAAVEHNNAAYLILVFPAIGLGLLGASVYGTLRYRKFGASLLELVAVPAPIGREIAGVIRTPAPIAAEHGIRIQLTCVRRTVTGSGKNRSTSESILWQDEQQIPGGSRQADGTVIPFVIPIPADATPSDDRDPNNRVIWRLTGSAEVPGVDFQAKFEVPVFHMPESDQPLSAEERRLHDPVAILKDYQLPTDSPITVRSIARGIEIVFPPARNPGAAAGLTLFFTVWSGLLYFMIRLRAPILFPIIVGGFDLVLLLGVLQLWLGTARVVAGREGLSVIRGILGVERTRSASAQEIQDVTIAIGMQAGLTVYYDIRVTLQDGNRLGAGGGLRDKREAEWLVQKLKEALKGG